MNIKNPVYSVTRADDGALLVRNRLTDTTRRHFATCFVYGQRGYDSDTYSYPNYVHAAVWDLVP